MFGFWDLNVSVQVFPYSIYLYTVSYTVYKKEVLLVFKLCIMLRFLVVLAKCPLYLLKLKRGIDNVLIFDLYCIIVDFESSQKIKMCHV